MTDIDSDQGSSDSATMSLERFRRRLQRQRTLSTQQTSQQPEGEGNVHSAHPADLYLRDSPVSPDDSATSGGPSASGNTRISRTPDQATAHIHSERVAAPGVSGLESSIRPPRRLQATAGPASSLAGGFTRAASPARNSSGGIGVVSLPSTAARPSKSVPLGTRAAVKPMREAATAPSRAVGPSRGAGPSKTLSTVESRRLRLGIETEF